MRLRVALVTTAAVAVSLVLAGHAMAADALPLTPAPQDALSRALQRGQLSEAQYALARASSLFDEEAVERRHGDVAAIDPRAATPILRDLVARMGSLAPAERLQAQAMLARPTDGPKDVFGSGYQVEEEPPACTEQFCVHWVATTRDAPPPEDADGNGRPDQVDATIATLEQVWQRQIVELGYRPPLDDSSSPNHGPDGRIDIYLKDVGAAGLYGFCPSDDPRARQNGGSAHVSAFCVLDNDYSRSQFPSSESPLAALQATAAHEFFHAVQFGYDYLEDLWMLEGSAVWMEDEVFDDVNDNYQYLDRSPLSHPHVPLDLSSFDRGSPLADFVYGSFVFYRYLSEHHGGPDVVRRAWELASPGQGGRDLFSVSALDAALKQRGSSLRTAFARFGAVNLLPRTFYEEGASYPTPPVSVRRTLSAARSAVSGAPRLDHLSTWYALLRPGARVGRNARLRVTLDLPARGTGASATLVIVRRSGAVTLLPVPLNARGDGARTVTGFNRASIESVHLVLSNASGRFVCYQGMPLSCLGRPVDDDLAFSYEARLLRGS